MNEKRITDYALNELQGDEREKFESDLAADQRLQNDLLASSRVADGLAQIMSEPGAGLEPRAREKLLRAIAENQQALRQRRKIVRFAVPISLAAAASIAVLLLVVGGKTTQRPAVAAASVSGGVAAQIKSKPQVFAFSGKGSLSSPETNYSTQSASQIGQRTELKLTPTRTVQARAVAGANEATIPLDPTEVRVRPLLWESPETLGLGDIDRHGNSELLAP